MPSPCFHAHLRGIVNIVLSDTVIEYPFSVVFRSYLVVSSVLKVPGCTGESLRVDSHPIVTQIAYSCRTSHRCQRLPRAL